MASSFQQQARLRKFIYLGVIVVLFSFTLFWRRADFVMAGTPVRGIDAQARALAIREEDRGEVELLGSAVRIGLTGSRGLLTCFLWNSAIEAQKKNQWNELEVYVRSLTKLQPHFITPWLFQSWNLSYNVSVESDRVRDKYYYMARGIELLAEGERQNSFHPDLRWSIGFYTQHKICQSDETNYLRSLFQLSLIPPNDRDPARFWRQVPGGEPVFNFEEYEKFCVAHPQLIRRLHDGIHRETKQQKDQLYRRETPEDVVEFLEENFSVPSLFVFRAPKVGPARYRAWVAREDEKQSAEHRFPVLPPRHDNAFDDGGGTVLTADSNLSSDVDGFAVAHAWYCYAQEPLPRPGPLPGSSQEVSDRVRQRRPRHMTTLIFRHYPAQGRRYVAERLQQEGWFDGQPWPLVLPDRAGRDGKRIEIGGDRVSSLEAWGAALRAWKTHGEENHLLLGEIEKANKMKQADRFIKAHRVRPAERLAVVRMDEMSEVERQELLAAQFMEEHMFYNQVSNFQHHYNRARVEAEPVTVQCRKLFFLAEQARLDRGPTRALEFYLNRKIDEDGIVTNEPVVRVQAFGDETMSPLKAWREKVLRPHKEYSNDDLTREQSAEIQMRYLWVRNGKDVRQGAEDKVKLARAAAVLPLVPKVLPNLTVSEARDHFPAPIVQGPFEYLDDQDQEKGLPPYIGDRVWTMVLERMNVPSARRVRPQTLPPDQQPGAPGSPTTSPRPGTPKQK